MPTLLIIEDVASVRFYHQTVLSRAGYQCLCAGNTTEAEAHLNTTPIDAIVLDRGLPGESGDAFLHRLRADPARQAIPVVVITTEIPEFCVAGVTYLPKPLTPKKLTEAVQHLISKPCVPNSAT